jgi:hypothetical protein
MSFSPSQQSRIILEKNLLDKYFPGRVSWHTPDGGTAYVEVVMVSNSNRHYTLRIYISQDFPNSCPEMVLVSPSSLNLKNGSLMPNVSHEYHTIGTKDGYLLLCHFTPSKWTDENTLYQVFMKGRLWIEGYEGHLHTGKRMDEFLKAQGQTSSESSCILI